VSNTSNLSEFRAKLLPYGDQLGYIIEAHEQLRSNPFVKEIPSTLRSSLCRMFIAAMMQAFEAVVREGKTIGVLTKIPDKAPAFLYFGVVENLFTEHGVELQDNDIPDYIAIKLLRNNIAHNIDRDLEIEGLQQEIEGLQQEIEGLQQEIEGSQQEIEGSQQEIEGSQQGRNDKTFKMKNNELKQLQGRMKNLEERMEQLRNERSYIPNRGFPSGAESFGADHLLKLASLHNRMTDYLEQLIERQDVVSMDRSISIRDFGEDPFPYERWGEKNNYREKNNFSIMPIRVEEPRSEPIFYDSRHVFQLFWHNLERVYAHIDDTINHEAVKDKISTYRKASLMSWENCLKIAFSQSFHNIGEFSEALERIREDHSDPHKIYGKFAPKSDLAKNLGRWLMSDFYGHDRSYMLPAELFMRRLPTVDPNGAIDYFVAGEQAILLARVALFWRDTEQLAGTMRHNVAEESKRLKDLEQFKLKFHISGS